MQVSGTSRRVGAGAAGRRPVVVLRTESSWRRPVRRRQESIRPKRAWAETRRVPASRRPAARVDLSKAVLPSDDWTFRPTVVVRRGPSQGSGTIIASVEGETLVLTASHVIRESGPISVELHRYNLGLERMPAPPGAWPRPIAAELAAIDRAADLAVLRIVEPRRIAVCRPAGGVASRAGRRLDRHLDRHRPGPASLELVHAGWSRPSGSSSTTTARNASSSSPPAPPSTAGPAAGCSCPMASWSASASDTRSCSAGDGRVSSPRGRVSVNSWSTTT